MPSAIAERSRAARSACDTRGIQLTLWMAVWSCRVRSAKISNCFRLISSREDSNRARKATSLLKYWLIPFCRIPDWFSAADWNSRIATRSSPCETNNPPPIERAKPMVEAVSIGRKCLDWAHNSPDIFGGRKTLGNLRKSIWPRTKDANDLELRRQVIKCPAECLAG